MSKITSLSRCAAEGKKVHHLPHHQLPEFHLEQVANANLTLLVNQILALVKTSLSDARISNSLALWDNNILAIENNLGVKLGI